MSHLFSLDDIKAFGWPKADGVALSQDVCFTAIPAGTCYDCTTVCASAKYVGDAPSVAFELWVLWDDAPEERLYRSLDYAIGSPNVLRHQQWWIPPIFDPHLQLRVRLTVPEGTELKDIFKPTFQGAILDPDSIQTDVGRGDVMRVFAQFECALSEEKE